MKALKKTKQTKQQQHPQNKQTNLKQHYLMYIISTSLPLGQCLAQTTLFK